MSNVFTVEFAEVELGGSLIPGFFCGWSGRASAKTLNAARRQAKIAEKANERRARDKARAEFGIDNGIPVIGHMKVWKNGNLITESY